MKLCTLTGLGGSAAALLIASNQASASYQYLQTTLYTTVSAGGQSRDVFRIYAHFSNPNDYMTVVAGSPTVGNLVIQNLDSGLANLGSGFFNPGGSSSNKAPYQSQIDSNPDLEWGTFATLGVPIGDMGSGPSSTDVTSFTPGFPTFINGNTLNTNNAAWYTPGVWPQGQASYINSGPDTDLDVLIMQLAVNQGERVRGTVSVSGFSSGSSFIMNGQTFDSGVPAPGGLGALTLAAFFGSRSLKRRRR